MTSSKAWAAAVAAKIVIVVGWLLTLIPGWAMAPDQVREAVHWLVTGGIAYLIVYYAPANRQTVDVPDSEIKNGIDAP